VVQLLWVPKTSLDSSLCLFRWFSALWLAVLILIFISMPVLSETVPEFGLPPIKVFTTADYQAHRQNWAIAQTADGMIYVGNAEGLLEYDGVLWRQIKIPGNPLVRALAVDSNNRVYVGAFNEIGYLTPDDQGQLQYQSLLPQLQPEHRIFADVWHCHANKRGVFFTTSGRLFRFGPDGVHSWPSQQLFVHSLAIGERFFLRDEGVGLQEQIDDELKLVPGGDIFAEQRLSMLVEWPGKGDLLAISRTLGFMQYNGEEFKRWPTAIDHALHTKLVSTALPLADGRLAVGMLQGGVVLLDTNGRNVGQLDRQSGLPDNKILKLMQDHEQGLWLATNNGIVRVQLGQGFSRFDLRHGLDGNVAAMYRFNGQLYVGTAQGLYRLQPGPAPKFEAVPGIAGSVWSLLQYQDQLLIANYKGVYRLGPAGAELLYSSDSVTAFVLLSGPTPVLLVAHLHGIIRLQADGQQWRLVGNIAGITENMDTMLRDSQGTVWAKPRGEQFLLRMSATNEDWVDGDIAVQRFNVGAQVPDLATYWLTQVQGQMRVIQQQRLYQLDVASGKFVVDPHFQALFENVNGTNTSYGITAIGDTPNGQWLLAQQTDRHGVIGKTVKQTDGSARWQVAEDTGSSGFTSWYRETDGRIWLGATELFQWDPAVPTAPPVPFQLLLRKVHTANGQLLQQYTMTQAAIPSAATASAAIPSASSRTTAPLQLGYQQNKLRFEFAATSYRGTNEYAVWLEGVDQHWSDWRKEAFIDYNSLWEGR